MSRELAHRMAAAQSCIDRFNGRELDWRKVDCGRIAAHNLHQLGIKHGLLPRGAYSSEVGAIKHLRRGGHDGLASAVDAIGLPPIPAAMALIADFIAMPVDSDRWDCALTVKVGKDRVFGILEGRCQVMQLNVAPLFAWRCEPWRK